MEYVNGDHVQLKSGGPVMRVAHMLRDGKVKCVWMEEGGRPGIQDFPKDDLVRVAPPEGKTD